MNQKRWIGVVLIGIGVLIILGNVGGLDDKTSSTGGEDHLQGPTLIVNYLAMFGGVEIKN